MMPPDLSAFGTIAALRPLTGGHRNRVWLVERGGVPLVAKSTARSEAALRWLGPVQAAARGAGFGVPGLIAAGDGRFAPQGWTLEPFAFGIAARADDLPRLGARIAAFHRGARAFGQRPGFVALPDLIGRDRGGDADLSLLPAPLAAAIRAAFAPFAGQAAQPVHGDLTASNLIHTAEGPALIDWDEARADLPFLDLIALRAPTPAELRAQLAMEVATGWTREPAHARTLAASLLAPVAGQQDG